MIKTILAAVLAGTFMIALPARADDKPSGEKTEKSDKSAKKSKKDKSGESKKEGAPSGGGW
jgi:hypothetical protein